MAANVELVWLPLVRVAALQGKSVKTIRRMIEEGSLVAVKRNVKGSRNHTNKSFVLADQQTVDLDREFCRRQGLVPQHLGLELIRIEREEYVSLFIVSYNKDKAAGYGQD